MRVYDLSVLLCSSGLSQFELMGFISIHEKEPFLFLGVHQYGECSIWDESGKLCYLAFVFLHIE